MVLFSTSAVWSPPATEPMKMAEPWAEPELATPATPMVLPLMRPEALAGAPLGLTSQRRAERIAEGVVGHAVGRRPAEGEGSDEPPDTGVSPLVAKVLLFTTTSVVEPCWLATWNQSPRAPVKVQWSTVTFITVPALKPSTRMASLPRWGCAGQGWSW